MAQWHQSGDLDKRKLTLRLSDHVYARLVSLARHEDRSLNGAAELALRVGVEELLPHRDRVTALGRLAMPAQQLRQRFSEHLTATGPCDCAAGETVRSQEAAEAKGGEL
jgi:hypothetical protein